MNRLLLAPGQMVQWHTSLTSSHRLLRIIVLLCGQIDPDYTQAVVLDGCRQNPNAITLFRSSDLAVYDQEYPIVKEVRRVAVGMCVPDARIDQRLNHGHRSVLLG